LNSRRKFVHEGLKQAGLVFATGVLLGVLTFFSSRLGIAGEMVGKLFVFIISILGGPSPIVLFHLDFSNKLIVTLWLLFIPIYWVGLGIIVGQFAWQTCSSTTENNQVPPPKKIMRLGVAGLSILAGFLLMVSLPSFVGGGSSLQYAIINNLRQIDAAKNQFALEKKVLPDYIPTKADLTPYILLRNGKFPQVGPERYVLNPIREAPYAVLDNDWRIRRHGWREGYTITNGTIYRLP
jgi:hypothetical protein